LLLFVGIGIISLAYKRLNNHQNSLRNLVNEKNGINEVGIVPEGYLQSTTTSETTTTSDSSNVISDGSGGDDTDVATHYTA
jgi:hypothetical protein